jgi:hypothetical protein
MKGVKLLGIGEKSTAALNGKERHRAAVLGQVGFEFYRFYIILFGKAEIFFVQPYGFPAPPFGRRAACS